METYRDPFWQYWMFGIGTPPAGTLFYSEIDSSWKPYQLSPEDERMPSGSINCVDFKFGIHPCYPNEPSGTVHFSQIDDIPESEVIHSKMEEID